MKKSIFILMSMFMIYMTGCDSATLDRIAELEAELEAIEEYDDADLLSTIADLQNELDAMEDYDDTILLETITELETQIDALELEIDSMVDYDDAGLLATIADLQNEIDALESVIGPVFGHVPSDQVIERYEILDLLSLGITASDNRDGDLTSSISVDIASTWNLTVGNHVATYSVTDSDGNTRSQTIDVSVWVNHWLYNYIVIHNNTEIMITGYKNDQYDHIDIPGSIGGLPVTTIGSYAFSYLGLYEVTFSENLVEIQAAAFASNNLSEVILPNSLEIIGDIAFQNNQMDSITIPENVHTIGSRAFHSDYFEDYFVAPNNPYFDAVDGILYSDDETVLLGYPNGREAVVYSIPEGVLEIGEAAFERCALDIVVFPSSLRVIGPRAFMSCGLWNATLPSGLLSMGYNAFAYNNLDSVVVPSGVVTIGDNAYKDNLLTAIVIQGDETRFNDIWTTIGFPEELKP